VVRANETGRPGTPPDTDAEAAANPEASGGARDAAAEESGAGAPEPSGAPETREGDVDFRDRWLRTEAELQNYRKRARRDAEESSRNAEERVMLELVHALDDLDRALAAAREANAPETWVGGVQLVANRIGEYLGRNGVIALNPVGELFDPTFHEAMLEVDAPDAEPGHVVQVILRGYRRGQRALRPARVVVARRPAGSA